MSARATVPMRKKPANMPSSLLRLLWAEQFGQDARVVLTRPMPNGKGWAVLDRLAWHELDRADEYAGQPNVYHGLALMPAALTGNHRGRAVESLAISCVWADVDVKPGGAGSIEDAIRAVTEFAEPTAITTSGSGIHPYWLLADGAWQFGVDDESASVEEGREAAADAVSDWQKAFAAHAGFRIDGTADLTRVLRLPGTTNAKTDPPKPVEIVHWNPDVRLDWDTYNSLTLRARAESRAARAAADTRRSQRETWLRENPKPLNGSHEYALRWLYQDAEELAAMQPGATWTTKHRTGQGRDEYLNFLAFTNGNRISEGLLDRATVESELIAAGIAAGIDDKGEKHRSARIVGQAIDDAIAKGGTQRPVETNGTDAEDRLRRKEQRKPRHKQPEPPVVEPVDEEHPAPDLEPTSTRRRRRTHVETWSEFRDNTPPEMPYVVDGLIPEGSLGFFAASPKAGKTWLSIALAIHVSTGRAYLGKFPVSRPRHVLYLALEGHRSAIRHRIGAIARGMGIDPDGRELDRLHLTYRPPGIDLGDPEWAAEIVDDAAECGAEIVIVDVLRAAAPKLRETGDGVTDFAQIVANLAPLQAAGAAVLLLHHFTKVNEATSSRGIGDRMSGSGSLFGRADYILGITKSEQSARDMRVEMKLRDGAEPDPFRVLLTGNGSGKFGGFTYEDTLAITTADAPAESVNDTRAAQAIEWMREQGGSATPADLKDHFKWTDDQWREMSSALRSRGCEAIGKGRATRWTAPSDQSREYRDSPGSPDSRIEESGIPGIPGRPFRAPGIDPGIPRDAPDDDFDPDQIDDQARAALEDEA